MIRVLFVCLGNICRSPMAEAVFKDQIVKRGIEDQFYVDSAATSAYEVGNPPHSGTLNQLKIHNIDAGSMRSRQVTKEDFEQFDYILAMDQNNRADLLAIAPSGTEDKIHLFLSVLPDSQDKGVPDPYYTGDFDETYKLISQGIDAWIDKMLEQR